jgi:hypothetical protein
VGVLVVGIFLAMLTYGTYLRHERDTSLAVIEKVKSIKLTLEDVEGKNLPPVPDQKLNESTVAGIDINKNHIRDDVELKIFEMYPLSKDGKTGEGLLNKKLRSGALQYAQGYQLELTEIISEKTAEYIRGNTARGSGCYRVVFERPDRMNDKEATLFSNKIQVSVDQINAFILNTDMRKDEVVNMGVQFKGFRSVRGNQCDLNLDSL